MDEGLERVISKFEAEIQKLNAVRSLGPHKPLRVTILGQQGLLIRRESLSNLTLLATTDFDARLDGEVPLADVFKRLLREEGISYDNDSDYIWLPEETKYETIYETKFILVDSPLPIYLIVSKAVKAPEKNKQLVTDAIVEFGDELLTLLQRYEADINYFV